MTTLDGSNPAPGVAVPGLMRGSLLYAGAHVAGLAASLGGNALLVRVATPQDVASYLMFLQAVSVLGLALQLGLPSVAQRFAPLMPGVAAGRAAVTLRRRLFVVQVAIWAAILPLFVWAWPAMSWRVGAAELGGVALALAAMGAMASLARLLGGWLRALRRYTASAVLDQLGPRALLALGLAAFFLARERVSWVALAALYSGVMATCSIGQAFALRRTADSRGGDARVAPPPVGEIASMTLLVGAQLVAATLLMSSDLWVLSAARSHREVAVYGMMLSLLQVVAVGSIAAQLVVPQEMSRLHVEGRRDELEALARTSATATLLVAALAAGVLVLFGRPLIAVLLGSSYVSGWGMLLVLLAGRLFDAAAGPAGSLLVMTGHHARVTVATLGAAALTILLALALAPRWGGYGVAAATSAGLVAVNSVNVLAARRLLGVRVTAYPRLAPYRQVLRRLVPRPGGSP